MAENLAFEQVLWQAAAVQRHERLALAPAEVVQAAGDQLFAGAGLAFDQHVGRGVGNVGDQFAQVLHGRRAANDPALQAALFDQLAAQGDHLTGQAALLQRAADHVDQALGREGLFHEVVGAVAHGADRHVDIAVAGDQHHRQAAVAGLEAVEQLQAIDARQADIADDDAGEIVADAFQCLLGAADAFAGDVLEGQRLLAAEQHMGIVFDDQNRQGCLVHRDPSFMGALRIRWAAWPGARRGRTQYRRRRGVRRSGCPWRRWPGWPTG